jgi:hypothetical protein
MSADARPCEFGAKVWLENESWSAWLLLGRIWLPDMDSNHDKLLQRQLCYRYTIGQAGARER